MKNLILFHLCFFHQNIFEKKSLALKSVNVNDRVEIVAEYILSQNTTVPVVDENNQTVGVLHPDRVLKILFPEKIK